MECDSSDYEHVPTDFLSTKFNLSNLFHIALRKCDLRNELEYCADCNSVSHVLLYSKTRFLVKSLKKG